MPGYGYADTAPDAGSGRSSSIGFGIGFGRGIAEAMVAIRSWSRENVPPLDQVARDKVERDVREWEPFFEAVRGFFGIPNPNPQDPNLSRQTDGFRSYRVGERSLSWNLDDDPAPTPAPPAVPSPFPDFESPNPTPTQEGPSGTGTSGTGTSGGVGVGESGFGSASEGQY